MQLNSPNAQPAPFTRASDPKPVLFQRLSCEGALFDPRWTDEQKSKFFKLMNHAHIVSADSAFMMFFDKHREKAYEDSYCFWRDVRCVRPRYPVMWLEGGLDDQRFGGLLMDTSEEDEDGSAQLVMAHCRPGEKPLVGIISMAYRFDAAGKTDPNDPARCTLIPPYQCEQWEEARMMNWRWGATGQVGAYLSVLSLLHASNVTQEHESLAPEYQKRCARQFGPREAGYRFHIIKIFGKRFEYQPRGESQGGGAGMPLHICAGHYAEYGPQFGKGLLFGKYAGEIWIPPCVKGKKENGTIGANYEVACPA